MPIFFGYTRSFLLGVVPILLTMIDMAFSLVADPHTAAPIAFLIAKVLGIFTEVTPEKVETVMRGLLPFYGLLIAQQRSGAARPYTIDPRYK